jgi:alpha-aminoadipate carrier protein LysW
MSTDRELPPAGCPECGAEVSLPAGTVHGEILPCRSCLAELEVLSVAPPQLALAPEIEEDWGE